MVYSGRSSLQLAFASCVLSLGIPACAPRQPAAVAVVPGLAVRLGQSPRPDTIVYQRSITRAGQDSSAGTRTVVLRVIDAPQRTRLLEVEQRFPGGGGEIVDTALAELKTLRAVAHRSHQPTRTMRFTFPGTEALGNRRLAQSHGRLGRPGSPATWRTHLRLKRDRPGCGGASAASRVHRGAAVLHL